MSNRHVPNISFQTNSTRRIIIASYWVVIILTVPLWWYTTSIERLSLPKAQVMAEFQHPLSNHVDVSVGWEGRSSVSMNSFAKNLEARLTFCGAKDNLAPSVSSRPLSGDLTSGPIYNVRLRKGSGPTTITQRTLLIRTGQRDDKYIENEVASLLCELLSPGYTTGDRHRTMQYSSNYRLAFSLLNQDASAGGAVTDWDVESAILKSLYPTLSRLSPVHNFSVESQVQFQSPLAFEPERKSDISVVTEEQLSVFVNSADWTLSSGITTDPVIHFIIYVPSPNHRPLLIERRDAQINERVLQSFIVPRWGGIILYNPSKEVFTSASLDTDTLTGSLSIFRSQLLQLLGLPELPKGLETSERVTDWQLDVLLRRRSAENVRDSREALGSIVRLVDSIPNLPVGDLVQTDVGDALKALGEGRDPGSRTLALVLKKSADALTLSSRAFFHPSMLAMMYFPAEHTYAVYLPLFAPSLMPLVVALFKEIKSSRRSRREVKEKAE